MTCGEQYLDESLGELRRRAVSDELVVWQSAVFVTRRRVALGDLDERRRFVVDARVQLPVDVERPRQIDVVARRVRRQTVGRARRTLLLQLPAARRPACARAKYAASRLSNKLSSRERRDDMPPPMAVRLAADLRPCADESAVRTLKY